MPSAPPRLPVDGFPSVTVAAIMPGSRGALHQFPIDSGARSADLGVTCLRLWRRLMAMFEGFTRTEIETSSARIHLRHGGAGPPLLLLHGNPLTPVSWPRIAGRLAEHFHVVASALRGYCDSVARDD